MPTGGVCPTQESLTKWLSAGAACMGMGSKLITKEKVDASDFPGITEHVRQTLEMISEIRKTL